LIVAVQKTFKGKIPLTILRLTPAGKSAFDAYKKSMNGLLASARTRKA
jgi:Winged helix DNA-binding domain